MPAQEPDGATTKSKGANASIVCSAMSRLVARSPELKAGWPQQLCGGTCTLQPASSRSFTAARPTDGRIRSTRQVTNSPPWRVSRVAIVQLPGRNGLHRQSSKRIHLASEVRGHNLGTPNELARPGPGEN